MPDGDNVEQASTSARSVLVRSDPNSGMALIQSKDGRTKWLTVSADPSSATYSWDERVRNWAGKLGVCAGPSSPARQATPLPTPPPCEPPSLHSNWTTSVERQSTVSVIPEKKGAPGAAETRAGGARRAGSFARGFLLGLGSGGVGLSTAKRDTGVTGGTRTGTSVAVVTATTGNVNGKSSVGSKEKGVSRSTRAEGDDDDRVDKPSASSVANGESSDKDMPTRNNHDVCERWRGGHVDDGKGMEVTDTMISGRQRWVKGAPPSPEVRDESCDWSCSSGGNRSSSDSDEEDDNDSSNSNTHHRPDHSSSFDSQEMANRISHRNDSSGADGRIGLHEQQQEGKIAGLSNRASSMASRDAIGESEKSSEAWIDAGTAGTIDGGKSWSATATATSSKASKNKKKKSKAKAKSKFRKAGSSACTAPTNPAETDVDAAANRSTAAAKRARRALHVTFGHVLMLEFTRDVGGCGVPSEGTWGLALGLPFRETMVEVDGYEASKAEILAAREEELPKKQRALSTGETRQFDYRAVGERNPLFGRLGEKDRSKCLLDYACFHKDDLKEADTNTRDMQHRSVLYNGDLHNSVSIVPDSDFSKYSHKISHAEFVDKSHVVAPELDAVRASRRESQGCSCACVRADKLNVARLREELNKRGLKVSGSKKNLTKALQEAMRAEEEKDGGQSHKACRSEECQCVRDGVECHADLCNCCKGPHVGKKDAHHGGVCSNPEGVYSYSSSSVRSYRAPFVTAKPAPGRERRHSRSDSMCSEHH